MLRPMLVTALALVLMAPVAASLSGPPSTNCPVTIPNGVGLGHGTPKLSTALMPIVVFELGGHGEVLRDGWLRWPKWPWRRGEGVRGKLQVRGRRLDERTAPLRVHICNECYGDTYGVPMAMDFPTPGCWEITGRVGRDTLTFIIRVIKIGNGPNRQLLI